MTETEARRLSFGATRGTDLLTIWSGELRIGSAEYRDRGYDITLDDGTTARCVTWPLNGDTHQVVAAQLREAIFFAKEDAA